MADPKFILWTSFKGLDKAFFTYKGGGIKVGIGYINYGDDTPSQTI